MRNFIIYILIIGIPINFIGEYLQVPLVNPLIILPRPILAMFAVACDIIIILLIHSIITKIYKDKFWAISWNIQKVLLVIILGIVFVVLGEKIALALGFWSYTNSMHVIPIINVGLTPVLQLATLPLITLYFASKQIAV